MIDVFLHQRTSMHGHLTEGVNTKVMFTVLLKFPIYLYVPRSLNRRPVDTVGDPVSTESGMANNGLFLFLRFCSLKEMNWNQTLENLFT